MPTVVVTVSKNVTTAGTRVPLSVTSVVVKEFEIQAKNANTGTIYFGGSDVAAANGRQLTAGQMFSVAGLNADDRDSTPSITIDLANCYIDSSVSGEGVILTYLTR